MAVGFTVSASRSSPESLLSITAARREEDRKKKAAEGPPRFEVRSAYIEPADRVYELISDVTRMGEWSPETTACAWIGWKKTSACPE